MKKKIINFWIVLFAMTMVMPTFASALNDDILPYAFNTHTGYLTLSLAVPSYTSPIYGYTVDSWECPLKIKYTITYDVNNGKIASVTFLGSELSGTALSPTEQGRLVSLNYETVNMSVVSGGYAIKCDYYATADLIYVYTPGFPINQETTRVSVSDIVTIDPPRP